MKKTLLVFALIGLGSSLSFAKLVTGENLAEEPHYCSASIITIGGQFLDPVRVDCSDEFAGKCLHQVSTAEAASSFVEIDKTACDVASQQWWKK